eukprot:m.38602 g.38602  ORF g.38602 m.38602 type:complete len:404 (+) comp9454_c0_seq1:167-1378(+)
MLILGTVHKVGVACILLISSIVLALPAPIEEASVQHKTSWSGGFQIHVFEVGQGHSQLVVFPSGFSILIDVMEPSWNTCKGARAVAEKVNKILGHTHVNVGTPSHWHLDHLGYAGYGGFWCLIEEGLLQFDTIIDRDGGYWGGDVNGNDECDEDEIVWKNAGTVSGTAINWVCYATNKSNEKIYNIRKIAKWKSSSQIVPGDNGAKVTVVAVDGNGVVMVDGKTSIMGDHTKDEPPPSENDYSIGLLIEYNGFRYITAGDSDGEYGKTQGFTYNDVETMIANLVGSVDVLLVNHHGSAYSSNANYLNALKPTASFISCGKENAHGHPAESTLSRLRDVKTKIYMNNICASDRNYHDITVVNGDIVLKSDNGITYFINGVRYESKAATHGFSFTNISYRNNTNV